MRTPQSTAVPKRRRTFRLVPHGIDFAPVQTLVEDRHASFAVKTYAIYIYYYHVASVEFIASLFGKAVSTVFKWIRAFNEGGLIAPAKRAKVYRKFNPFMRAWVVMYFMKRPLAYLDEARQAFVNHFMTSISITSVLAILRCNNMTRKVR